jgi:hypothetical protein
MKCERVGRSESMGSGGLAPVLMSDDIGKGDVDRGWQSNSQRDGRLICVCGCARYELNWAYDGGGAGGSGVIGGSIILGKSERELVGKFLLKEAAGSRLCTVQGVLPIPAK